MASICQTGNGLAVVLVAIGLSAPCTGQDRIDGLPVNHWVKLSPLASTPPSPRLGYEGACAWDGAHQRLLRYGGHNQGGGGEQNSEFWAFDPLSARWRFYQPNLRPPGICCGQQNVWDPIASRYLRFPAFSHSHGWQWYREVYLNNSSIWSFDVTENTWQEMRPLPAPHPRPLRCASWDSDRQVLVMFGGEGSSEGTWVYDPSRNEWTEMHPPVQPADRSAGNMAYDAYHKLHILFGSQYQDDPHTWAYDLQANRWIDMRPRMMPPTKKNDAVLAYDSVNRVVLAVVKSGKDVERQEKEPREYFAFRLETWSYDVGRNAWKRLCPQRRPDPSCDRARQLVFAPEQNLFLLENRTGGIEGHPGEQQIWTYRYAKRSRRKSPPAPRGLSAETSTRSVTLSWNKTRTERGEQVDRYRIFRAMGDQPWRVTFAQLADVDGTDSSYVDRDVRPKTMHHYYVTAVTNSMESRPSVKVKTQPPVPDGLVVSVLGLRRVALKWLPMKSPDIVGYRIERAVVEVYSEDQLRYLKSRTRPLDSPSVGAVKGYGPFVPIHDRLVVTPHVVDQQVDLARPVAIEADPIPRPTLHEKHLDLDGKAYRFAVFAYRVRGVNRLGCVGGPSPAVLTIPAPVEQLFAREDGTTCRLRWTANEEAEIRGYRVYRLDGRWDTTDAVTRLTRNVLRAVHYEDSTAGPQTRRYHVIAVDAVGQEGQPSPPVWYRRRWQRFYTPFVDQWHQ